MVLWKTLDPVANRFILEQVNLGGIAKAFAIDISWVQIVVLNSFFELHQHQKMDVRVFKRFVLREQGSVMRVPKYFVRCEG